MQTKLTKLTPLIWYYNYVRRSFFRSSVPYPEDPDQILTDHNDYFSGPGVLIEIYQSMGVSYPACFEVKRYTQRLAYAYPEDCVAIPQKLAKAVEQDTAVQIFLKDNKQSCQGINKSVDKLLATYHRGVKLAYDKRALDEERQRGSYA